MAKRITVFIPTDIKGELEKMAEEVAIPQSGLITLSVISLLTNYRSKGSFIFVDLFVPGQIEDESETKQLTVHFSNTTKTNLEKMSKETKIAQSQLAILATQSMLKNYMQDGLGVFKGLLESPK